MKRDSFVVRRSFYEPIKDLGFEDKGLLFDAICKYALDETASEGLSESLQMAFRFISSNIDRDAERYQTVIDRNRQNGSKGGRPANDPNKPKKPKKPSGLSGNPNNPNNPEEPKKPVYDSVSDSVSVNDRKTKKTKVFTPPTILEVIEFFKSKGSTENRAKEAFEYYELGNWTDSKADPVKNWKQKMNTNWINSTSYSQTDRKPSLQFEYSQTIHNAI